MGDDRSVHCFHHQGVADPGTLTVTGRAEDGLHRGAGGSRPAGFFSASSGTRR